MNQAPYDQLFIYEVDGDARARALDLGPQYLGLWLEGDSSFLFFSRPNRRRVEKMLAGDPDLHLREVHQLSYDQWQGGLSLEPLEMEGLAVVPAWLDYRPPPERAGLPIIRLDPGLVFGSGLHPTTRHCLELLLLRARRGPLGRVLDLGCGTGILALAALALGSPWALAVDLNPLCAQTTRKNAALNGLELETAEGPALDYLARPASLALANLPWAVMGDLLADPAPLAGKRDLIISGITRSHVGALRHSLVRLGYNIIEERRADDTWFSVWAGEGA